ncbi:MAG TPA: hypothetical protein VMZ30_15095 [Pyrinomonadaceae bacterium]|nr:hypothetical protein [Pyrinomonadaceae bacterium]
MNEANKNEVDLLLRSLSRARKNSALQSALTSVEAPSTDHLDADELNSYAEGVVPAPARVRYAEHLADCAVCRRIVVDLTQAAGAAGRHEVAEQHESSLWHKLAAILSPSVLRFAVPALVLTIVIGIGLFVFRQQRHEAFVAQNQPATVEPRRSDTGLNPPGDPSPATRIDADQRTFSDTAEVKGKVQDKKLQAGQAPPGSDSSFARSAPAKDAEEADPGVREGLVMESRPSSAARPKAAEPPPPLEAEKSANVAIDGLAKRENQQRARDEFKKQSDDIHGPNRSRSDAPVPGGARTMGGVAGERGPSAMNKNNPIGINKSKSGEVETRTVVGKRFARDGGQWVDTDYESQATIKISRSSEQFRALVADEPGIRTIAERLDGVIIVVWKGRAYRIQ